MNENKLKCSICGRQFIKVCAHVWQKHEISAKEYKRMLGYDTKKGIITDDHRELLRTLAIKNDMPARLQKLGQVTRFKKGVPLQYERSKETVERLRERFKVLSGRKKIVESRECLTCERQFTPTANTGKYCGRDCYWVARRQQFEKTSEHENKGI